MCPSKGPLCPLPEALFQFMEVKGHPGANRKGSARKSSIAWAEGRLLLLLPGAVSLPPVEAVSVGSHAGH